MTTAPARAVSSAFVTTLRAALMAAAAGAVLVGLSPSAMAASCATTAGNDTCIITLGDLASTQDGQAGTDRLQFNDAAALNVTASQFATTGNFLNFEEAQVVAGTTLNITSAATDAPVSMAWIVDGILNVTGGNAIGNTSAMTVNGAFNVNDNETIGNLAGTGSVVIAGTKVLTSGGASATTTFSGTISGAGGFTSGAGILTLSGNNSYSGGTTVTGGTLIMTGNNSSTGAVAVNGGALEIGNAGAIDNAVSVGIALGGTLRGTAAYAINGDVTNNGNFNGNVTVTGNVTNNGAMAPGVYVSGSTTPQYGTMAVVGNYTAGATSFLDMQIDLDAALPGGGTPGTTHDYLAIQGNTLGSNPTYIFLTEADLTADAGLATTGDGIRLVSVTTGTTTASAFQQGNALSSGAYQYLLRYVADYAGGGGADGFFLQSAVRDEMIAHPALLSAGQALVRHCFRDDQRIPDSPKGATYGRAWVGYHQGNTSFGADTGIDMNEDFNCTTGGMDWRAGYGWFGGVSGGFGHANSDLATPAGVGTLDGDARVIEGYASFTSSSLFINLSAGYADMDWTYTGRLVSATTTSSTGFIGSAQAGVALDVAPFAVKLIGAINYDGTNCGDSCFGFAVTEDTGLIEAKGTIRFDGVTWGGAVRPWAAVSYSDVLSDGINTVSLDAVSVSADTNDQLLMVEGGLQTYLDENLALFADGGYHESLAKDITGYKAGVGLKLYW